MSTELRSLKLLLVEDQASDAELLICYFERSGLQIEYRMVEDEAALREALAEPDWDAVISDYSLPELEAPEALIIVKTLRPGLPFIVISGTTRETEMAKLLEQGASECLLKDKLSQVVQSTLRIVASHKAG